MSSKQERTARGEQPPRAAKTWWLFMMHAGMDGQHDFRMHVVTHDLKQPEQEIVIRSNWVP